MAKLKEKSMRELLELQQGAHLICAKYENLNKMNQFDSRELNETFVKFKEKYDLIIDEIEKRIEAEIC